MESNMKLINLGNLFSNYSLQSKYHYLHEACFNINV